MSNDDVYSERPQGAPQRESEERLRQFGEASQDILWICDAETLQWQYLTPAFETVYGISRADALSGNNYHTWLDLIVPDDRAGVIASIRRVRAGEHASFEYRIRRPSDGQIRWMRDTDFPIYDDTGKVHLIGGIGHDATAAKASAAQEGLLLAELQHRVRNVLATIRAIAFRTTSESGSVEDFKAHFQGRIAALARTQSVLIGAPGEGADLELLVLDELLSQAAPDSQFTIRGPALRLASKAAEVVALVVHELVTNATKYGALTQPRAHIDIDWHTEPRDGPTWLVLTWTERGLSFNVAPSPRTGFGTELITRRIPYELRGTGTIEVHPDGLHAEIAFPLADRPSIFQPKFCEISNELS